MLHLPNYTLINRLGHGSYGQVFLARKKGTNEVVAIKCIPRTNLSKRAQDNLVSEIAILQKLSHPHIVSLSDFSWDGNKVYLYMEYCAGGDLSQFIHTECRLKENIVRRFLRQLGLALQYLHEKNIVHMDLKPQNILLTSKTHPVLKVTDFGFAQRINDTVQLNELRGTLLYMAPEIYGQGIYHPSCDLWSVGVILYECLFGSPPYASTNSKELKQKLLTNEAIEIPQTVRISDNCAVLLRGLLKCKPEARMNHEEFFGHPFLDLKHAPRPESLEEALTLLEQAHALENAGNMNAAYESYTRGLAHLVAAVDYETSPPARQKLSEMARDYFGKAEQVKTRLRPSTKTDKPVVQPAAVGSSKSAADVIVAPTIQPVICSAPKRQFPPPSRKPPTPPVSETNESSNQMSGSIAGYFMRFFRYTSPTSQVSKPNDAYKLASRPDSQNLDSHPRASDSHTAQCQSHNVPIIEDSLHQVVVDQKLDHSVDYVDSTKPIHDAEISAHSSEVSNNGVVSSIPTTSVMKNPKPCSPDADDQMKRLKAFTLRVGTLGDRESSHQESSVNGPSYAQQMALITDTERLLTLKSTYGDSDTINVLETLQEFYNLLRCGQIVLAFSHFETTFGACLAVAKADKNEQRRRAILKELKLVLDLVESGKRHFTCPATSGHSSTEDASDTTKESGAEVLIRADTVDEGCSIS